MKISRKDFIEKSLRTGIVAGTALASGHPEELIALEKTFRQKGRYGLVALRGGMPDKMFARGIAAMGGMGRYVKRGQTVVVKPNIGWNAPPERGANTNPLLVKAIINECLGAGAKKVYVFDHTCDEWRGCYRNSGIESMVKSSGGIMVPAHSKGYYNEVKLPKGKSLSETMVHEQLLEADVFINVPVLKHHSSTGLTIAMKNMMGVVWNRRWWHIKDLHQCIADFATWRKPDLVVVDAWNVMKVHGPRGISTADLVTMKAQLISEDPVTADAAAAKLFGKSPSGVRYIALADRMGVGTMDLTRQRIKRIKM